MLFGGLSAELLADCLRSAQDIGPEMAEVYERLRGIKNALRKLKGRRVSPGCWTPGRGGRTSTPLVRTKGGA